jgi:adenine-specific DNA glycosylase
LMDFGATWCTPRAPRCRPCPMRSSCATYRTGYSGGRARR